MILCYIPNQIEDDKLQSIKNLLNDRYMMFFCEVGDGIEIISESNQKILRDIITQYKPILFFMDSIIDSNLSATVISELVIFLLNHNCIFQSQKENIYFESSDINNVYSKIFEIFKKENHNDL